MYLFRTYCTIAILAVCSPLVYSDGQPKLNSDAVYPLMFLLGGVPQNTARPAFSDNSNVYSVDYGIPDPNPQLLETAQSRPENYETHQAKSAAAWLMGKAVFSDKPEEKIQLGLLSKYGDEALYNPCQNIVKTSYVKNDPTQIQCFGR